MKKIKNEYEGKKVATLDIDGTIFMSSLLMKHYDLLIQAGILPKSELLRSWENDQKNDGLIYETATEYKERLKDITLRQAQQVAKMLVNSIKFEELHPFVLSEIEKLKKSKTEIILISGSPKFIVKEFAKKLNVKGYGSIYKTCEQGFFNGEIQGMWGAEHKQFLVEHLGINKAESIISYGDTVGDIGLFHHSNSGKYLIEPTEENEKKIKALHEDIIIIRR